MMFCTKCGRKIPEGARFCPGCGQTVPGTENGNKQEERRPVKKAGMRLWILPAVLFVILLALLAVLILGGNRVEESVSDVSDEDTFVEEGESFVTEAEDTAGEKAEIYRESTDRRGMEYPPQTDQPCFLSQAPFSSHLGESGIQEYELSGRVVKKEKGFSVITDMPEGLPGLPVYEEDFDQDGKIEKITFLIRKEEEDRSPLWLQWGHSDGAPCYVGQSAFSLSGDRETFCYLVSEEQNAYLVLESLENDTDRAENDIYHFSSGQKRVRREYLTIYDVAEYSEREFSCVYVYSTGVYRISESCHSFKEKGGLEVKLLYKSDDTSGESLYAGKEEAMAYIREELKEYGLEGRIGSDIPSTENCQTVFLSKVTGMPQKVDMNEQDQSIRGTLQLGF